MWECGNYEYVSDSIISRSKIVACLSVAGEGEQLVEVVHCPHADEAAQSAANQCCYETDQGYL